MDNIKDLCDSMMYSIKEKLNAGLDYNDEACLKISKSATMYINKCYRSVVNDEGTRNHELYYKISVEGYSPEFFCKQKEVDTFDNFETILIWAYDTVKLIEGGN